MRLRFIIILIITLLVSSCGGYEKLLKSSDFELKKTKAKEYFDEGKYVRTTELLDQIMPQYRATEEAEGLSWLNAQSYYGMKDYYMAGAEFKKISDMYPYGEHAEEASYMTAMCDYFNSPRPDLDQTNTNNSIEGFSIFIRKFPASAKVEDARRFINELSERLVEKSYNSAKLYYDMKQYKAAVVALDNSLKEYPETKYREEMMFLKLNSLFLYAENSVIAKQTERYQAALDDYFSFMEEFPKTDYSKEVSRIYQSTAKKLNIDPANNPLIN
jgi:outer membrane protein assembly factor BamD